MLSGVHILVRDRRAVEYTSHGHSARARKTDVHTYCHRYDFNGEDRSTLHQSPANADATDSESTLVTLKTERPAHLALCLSCDHSLASAQR